MNKLKSSKKTALLFFAMGTALFLLHLLFRHVGAIVSVGFIYVIVSIVINSIIVLVLLFDLIINKRKLETLYSIGILLLNIPIAYLYLQIVLGTII